MIPRLPNRQTAALEPHQTEIMTVDQPKDIPKINWRKFFDPVYVIATFGAAFCMMGISFPVGLQLLPHLNTRIGRTNNIA